MITVELQGDRELVAKLTLMPEKLKTSLARRISALAIEMEARVKQKLNGQVLNVRSGALRRSITHDVQATSTSVTGRVFSSGDVKYAAIHEFGGQTSPHIILPKSGKALAFQIGGKDIVVRKVNHPGSKIPARPYMRPTFAEMREKIVGGLTEAVKEGLQ